MAFKRVGTLEGDDDSILQVHIITNSDAVTEADPTKLVSGFALRATAGLPVLGHVVTVVDANGVGVTNNGSGGDFTGTYTAASDNQTVAQVAVRVNISKAATYSVGADATLGTTTGSDLAGYRLDLTDHTQLDESSAVTGTSSATYNSHGEDPKDSTKLIVNILESAIFGPLS